MNDSRQKSLIRVKSTRQYYYEVIEIISYPTGQSHTQKIITSFNFLYLKAIIFIHAANMWNSLFKFKRGVCCCNCRIDFFYPLWLSCILFCFFRGILPNLPLALRLQIIFFQRHLAFWHSHTLGTTSRFYSNHPQAFFMIPLFAFGTSYHVAAIIRHAAYAMQFVGPTIQSFPFLLLAYDNHIGHESFHVHSLELSNSSRCITLWLITAWTGSWLKGTIAAKAMAIRQQSSLRSSCWTFTTNMVNDFSFFEIWHATWSRTIGYLIPPSILLMLNACKLLLV